MASQFNQVCSSFLSMLILISSSSLGWTVSESARIIKILNNCNETIWPGFSDDFHGKGFGLKPGQTMVFNAPIGWSGRIWGSTGCSFGKNGTGTCQTGPCSGSFQCPTSGNRPVTLAEFSIAAGASDFYSISLDDGFNIPISIKPINSKGNCSTASCDGDLRVNCPSELAAKVNGKTVGCRSACNVFYTDVYCCRSRHGTVSTCQSTVYSRIFKEACPSAYTYIYDEKDQAVIFTCTTDANYIVTFCKNSLRNQKACTSHDKKLGCSGSPGHKLQSQGCWILILLFTSWFMF